MTYYTVTRG